MSLYSSDSQEGLLGPTPHRPHTGDKHAPLQPHLASWEVANARASLLQPNPAGILFSFFFLFLVLGACPRSKPPPKAPMTSLVLLLPAFSSTCLPTAMAQGVPAPHRGVSLENQSFAHTVPCSPQAQSSSMPTQEPVPTTGSALFLTAARNPQTSPRVTSKSPESSRAQDFLCVP